MLTKEDITRKNALVIFDWCKKTFGVSTINGPYPKLVFRRVGKEVAGYYDPWRNEIHVFKQKHRTFMGFIGTVIHEFIHYRFHSIKKQYQKLDKIYTYKSHPMEREANKIERKYKWLCYYDCFSPNDLFQNQ
jgi:hypothetical protein